MFTNRVRQTDREMSANLRKYPQIPIFICEYHHDALRFFQKSFGSFHLSLEREHRPSLIHFDAHPDLVVPDIEPSLLYDRQSLVDNLSIENWIIPMCASGLIDEVTWIKQGWAHQIEVGTHSFNVGVCKETNKLAVDSTLEYFLGEGTVSLSKDLKEPKKVILRVMDLEDVGDDTNILNTDRPFILDVDLDFYSTNNPFWEIYKKAGVYAELREIYKFSLDKKNLGESLDQRRKQLKYLQSIFTHLEKNKSLEEFQEKDHAMFEKVEYLVKVLSEHYELTEVDFLLIHDAGCTWDTFGLPDHRSSEAEIDEAMERSERFLRSLPDPVLITVSRSSEDDYCPPDQVEAIQEKFLSVLKKVYQDRVSSNPIYYYKDESMG